ncbi:WXG100 family type VII secretion target [Nocardia sp. NPDC060256]|uniref:WXG100 family type VII secretion target n=1 Tax=unclassified Nocardia TaxID=2637762 RepID=UPI003654429D
MEESINIDPDGLRSAAAMFDDITDQLKKLTDTLVNSTNGEGEAWGDDRLGKKFAKGDKGYLVGRDNSFKNLSQLADILGQNATNLRDTANVFEENEKAQSGRPLRSSAIHRKPGQ